MKNANKFCNETCMRIANLITCFLLIMVAFIKFSYLSNGFNFFYLVHIFCKIGLVIILAMAEQFFGVGKSINVRTYFNLLDSQIGKGVYIIFISITLVEETDKNETFFVYIALFVAIINIVLGYKDELKELPAIPWAHLVDDHEEQERDKKPKSAKEMNRLKSKIDK